MKILLLIFGMTLTITGSAQLIDTIYVRNLSMQAQDWLWLTGRHPAQADSLTIKGFRTLRKRAQEVAGSVTMTTQVNIDSVPGKVLVEFYRIAKTAPAGEIAARYTAITSAIAAKTILTNFISGIDSFSDAEFIRGRTIGKYILLDQ